MDFADFYQTTSPRTLRYAYGLTGDLPLAQDVTQEAYARAWQRWRTVSGHHDIEAWLRVVVTRLVFDWWRRLRVHRTRMERPQTVPAPSEETVLLSAALKRLPRAQAQALALHYLLDLTIAQIAEETGVPEGTVKSWLSRGRAGLAEVLRDEVQAARLAPTEDVQQRGARRRRTQMIVAGIAVLAVIAGLGVWRVRSGSGPAPATTPSPSVSPRLRAMQQKGVLPDRMPDGYMGDVTIAGDRGYAAWSPPGGPATTVTAIDLTNGAKLWTATDVPSDVGLLYANSEVVLVQGVNRVDGSSRVIGLSVDGTILWSHATDRKVALLPYRDVLVQADLIGGTVAGLNWRTGEPVWQFTQQPLVAVVPMRSARDAAAAAPRLVATETGSLLVITTDGGVREVDPASGQARQTWSGVPVGLHSIYSAFEGKLYAAVGNRLSTVDLGGPGPSVSYDAPSGHSFGVPVACFGIAVCVVDYSAKTQFLVVRDHAAVLNFEVNPAVEPSYTGGMVLLHWPRDRSQVPTVVWQDPDQRLRVKSIPGDVIWIISPSDVLAVLDSVLDSGYLDAIPALVGQLPGNARLAVSDGVSLVAVTDQGIAVCHLTQ